MIAFRLFHGLQKLIVDLCVDFLGLRASEVVSVVWSAQTDSCTQTQQDHYVLES